MQNLPKDSTRRRKERKPRKKRSKTKTLMIKQVRSPIGVNKKARRTLEALGLRKPGSRVLHKDTPAIRGMIQKVFYLVRVEENA